MLKKAIFVYLAFFDYQQSQAPKHGRTWTGFPPRRNSLKDILAPLSPPLLPTDSTVRRRRRRRRRRRYILWLFTLRHRRRRRRGQD